MQNHETYRLFARNDFHINQLFQSFFRNGVSDANGHGFKTIYHQSIANDAVNIVLNREEVIKANAINTEKQLLLAFEVEQFERFELQEIEKNIKKQLKQEFKDMEIEVSYDPKIMLEIEKVQEKIKLEEMDKDTLKKEMKHIVKLKHEKT